MSPLQRVAVHVTVKTILACRTCPLCVTSFLNLCMCLHMHVLHTTGTTSRGVGGVRRWDNGDPSKLNGTGALQGICNNTGLTDPTKWPIKSQRRNLESKKIPNPTTVIHLDRGTHKKGEGVQLSRTKSWGWNCGFVFSHLKRKKLNYSKHHYHKSKQVNKTTSKKQIKRELTAYKILKLRRKCVWVGKGVHENLTMCV